MPQQALTSRANSSALFGAARELAEWPPHSSSLPGRRLGSPWTRSHQHFATMHSLLSELQSAKILVKRSSHVSCPKGSFLRNSHAESHMNQDGHEPNAYVSSMSCGGTGMQMNRAAGKRRPVTMASMGSRMNGAEPSASRPAKELPVCPGRCDPFKLRSQLKSKPARLRKMSSFTSDSRRLK